MRAIQLDAPGPPEALHLRELPLPDARPGQVRIRVEAFGLNRSELHLRQGLAENATFPRVPGIECAGVVDAAPGAPFQPGQQVVAMMGGMGRKFDGGYAEYAVVPASQVIPFRSDLPWEVIGALPEMLQTAHGSLTTGLDLRPGQTLLVRGGTSSVGLAAAALARELGAKVLATTRQRDRLAMLAARGVDHPLLDGGEIAGEVRKLFPEGVDATLELVGAPTLRDSLRATRVHGAVCFTGMVSNAWIVPDFYPLAYIPNGVRLTAYGGEAADLPAEALQRYLDAIAAGRLSVAVHRVYAFEQIQEAHAAMEQNQAVGKLVVRVRHDEP
jgi:NADPH:quinone reductase-like Zn-dependent oxidoreductase